MNALYLLLNPSMWVQPSDTAMARTSEEPIAPIRPGAFARWIADIEARATRDEFATNEGIAAARPDALPEPG